MGKVEFNWSEVRMFSIQGVNKVLKANFVFWQEDVVQDVLVKLMLNYNLFDVSKGSFKNWVITIARNTALDFIRVNKNYFSDIDLVSLFLLDDEEIDIEAMFILLDEVMNRLADREKQLLMLKYYEQKSGREIAGLMDIPKNQVPMYVQRAKQKAVQIAQQMAA